MSDTQEQLEAMAEEILELSMLSTRQRTRNRGSAPGDFSESEFMAMDVLAKNQPMTIGEIQKHVAVVPAQMSRIIRSLEDRGYINCSINAQDRRRVDVTITEAGKEAYTSYRTFRLKFLAENLFPLTPTDRTQFMRILRLLRQTIETSLASK